MSDPELPGAGRPGAPAGPPVHRYRVFGLNLSSDRELPSLTAADFECEPDVTVNRGAVDEGQVRTDSGLFSTEAGPVLVIPAVAKYLIRDGRQIVVDGVPGASDRNINLYLLGSALGALLHQRGLLPLHANLIGLGGGAVAFMGHSGAGKSTLAAWFHDRGYPILGDDVCVADIKESGVLVQPGMPRLRLWREALERTGRTTESYEMSFDDYDKYDVPTDQPVEPAPVPLIAIYELSKAEDGEPGRIAPLSGVDAVDSLVANTYRGSFLATPESRKRHLQQCLEVLRAVPLFRAERAWGLDNFAQVALELEAHALAMLAKHPRRD